MLPSLKTSPLPNHHPWHPHDIPQRHRKFKTKASKMINHRKIWGKWRETSKNNLRISLTMLSVLFIVLNCFLKHYVVLFPLLEFLFLVFFMPRNDEIDPKDSEIKFSTSKKKLRVEFYYFAFIRFIPSQSKMKRQKKWCNIKKSRA
jgi:Ca2+/Na+ antiporter